MNFDDQMMLRSAEVERTLAALRSGQEAEPRAVLCIGDETWTLRLPDNAVAANVIASRAIERTHAAFAVVTVVDGTQPSILISAVGATDAMCLEIAPQRAGGHAVRPIECPAGLLDLFRRGMGGDPPPRSQWREFGANGRWPLVGGAQ